MISSLRDLDRVSVLKKRVKRSAFVIGKALQRLRFPVKCISIAFRMPNTKETD